MPRQRLYQAHHDPCQSNQPEITGVSRDELQDALLKAYSCGRADLARRLMARLVGLDQTLTTYELAVSSAAGGAR